MFHIYGTAHRIIFDQKQNPLPICYGYSVILVILFLRVGPKRKVVSETLGHKEMVCMLHCSRLWQTLNFVRPTVLYSTEVTYISHQVNGSMHMQGLMVE